MFGEVALRWSSAAARLLGWRPREFWDSTPAELAACLLTTAAGEPVTGDDVAKLQSLFPDG